MLLTWLALVLAPLTPVVSPYRPVIGASVPVPDLPKPWPQSLAISAHRMVEDRFKSGSTLVGELARHGIDTNMAVAVVAAAATTIDMRRIQSGQRYNLYFDDDDQLTGLRYQVDRQTAYFVSDELGSWRTDKVIVPVVTRPAFITARVYGSLHASLAEQTRTIAGASSVANAVADVFGWDIDFNYEIQPGDRLDAVVEERFAEDEFIGYGDVLAAELHTGGRVLRAVHFEDNEGREFYFSPDGQSLRRTFLKSAVKYQRISSGFSFRRVHPVTGVSRAHRGVDYVARPGTPVQATADGVIEIAGYGPEQGRYVKIRHGGSNSSFYLHLSRIDEKARRGAQIKQGDVIGYVGKTGSATGYHLHYALMRGGQYVDPIKVQFPVADPIPADDRAAFNRQRDRWLAALRSGQIASSAQIAGGGL